MGESLPAAGAAPGDETADAANPLRSVRRRWWRVRIPTSIIVTVLVAALTAWVAPAVTRQWDDRQKAREVKAAFADEIVEKGTRAIVAFQVPPRQGTDPAVFRSLRDRWALQSRVLNARLRVYFPPNIAERWSDLYLGIYLLLDARALLQREQQQHAGHSRPEIRRALREPKPGSLEEGLLDYFRGGPEFLGIEEDFLLADMSAGLAADIAGPNAGEEEGEFQGRSAMFAFGEGMQDKLDEFTAAVLESHPYGFSTTRDDLIDDLLP